MTSSDDTVVTCDNCGQEEPFHDHVRVVTIVMLLSDCSDPGIDDLGLPSPKFLLCGWCAGAVRGSLELNKAIACLTPDVTETAERTSPPISKDRR